MNVGGPNGGRVLTGPRESEMPVVVIEPRKGKSVVSEGALPRIMFSGNKTR